MKCSIFVHWIGQAGRLNDTDRGRWKGQAVMMECRKEWSYKSKSFHDSQNGLQRHCLFCRSFHIHSSSRWTVASTYDVILLDDASHFSSLSSLFLLDSLFDSFLFSVDVSIIFCAGPQIVLRPSPISFQQPEFENNGDRSTSSKIWQAWTCLSIPYHHFPPINNVSNYPGHFERFTWTEIQSCASTQIPGLLRE